MGNIPPPPIPPPPEYRRNVSPPKEEIATARAFELSAVPVAPSPTPKSTAASTASGHVLDSLLEELQNVAKTATASENANLSSINGGSSVPPPPSVTGNTNGTERNGAPNGNGFATGEKRVGFVDEVQVVPHDHDSNESDTIKRAPKANGGYSNSPQPNTNNGYGPNSHADAGSAPSSILVRQHAAGANGHPAYNSYGLPSHLTGGIGGRRRSASPLATSSGLAISNAMLQGGNRSHSGTPSSVTSDPSAYHYHHPPPPPPRSSSRTMLVGGGPSNSSHPDARFKNFDLDELKQQLLFGSAPTVPNGPKGPGVVTATPAAIVQTNAVDDEPRLLKSASSSESVNSQDGREHRQRHQRLREDQQLLSPPGKPPPPPPPPRNKQEMLEQRQHELLTKQLQQQQQNRYVSKFQM